MSTVDRPIWMKDPLAILAENARGVVVHGGRIIECVAAGPTPNAVTFDAAQHVMLPGLINTHFKQALPPATV